MCLILLFRTPSNFYQLEELIENDYYKNRFKALILNINSYESTYLQ